MIQFPSYPTHLPLHDFWQRVESGNGTGTRADVAATLSLSFHKSRGLRFTSKGNVTRLGKSMNKGLESEHVEGAHVLATSLFPVGLMLERKDTVVIFSFGQYPQLRGEWIV